MRMPVIIIAFNRMHRHCASVENLVPIQELKACVPGVSHIHLIFNVLGHEKKALANVKMLIPEHQIQEHVAVRDVDPVRVIEVVEEIQL